MTSSGNDFKFSTLVAILRYRALHQPDQLAFTFLQDGETASISLTYQELDRQARMIAAQLQSLNAIGERALLLYPPGLEFIAAFLGCLSAGVVAVPAYPPRPNQSMSRLQAIVSDAQASVALTTTSLFTNIEVRLGQNLELAAMRWLATDNLKSDQAANWQEPEVSRDTLAFLQYTSGSTGTPKGVMVSHGNLLHNERMIERAFGHTKKTIVVGWLPLFHDMGLIGNVLQPLYLGIPCILMSPVDFLQKPCRWLQAISRYKATTSGGPNFAYDLCVRKITPEQRASLDLSSWEVAFTGAEPIRAQTLEQFAVTFESCGFRREAFYPCYGMAETTLMISGGLKTALPIVRQVEGAALEQNRVVATADEQEGDRTIVSCGRTWLDQKIAIVDPESLTQCPASQVGEIWVSGPHVAQGYWHRRSQTEQTFNAYLADTAEGPFLRTGDLGFLQNGELFVTGRLKDLIIIRGRNHYPQDIELTVEQSHPALRAGCGAAFAVEVEGEEQLVVAQEVERSYLRNLNVDEVVEPIRKAVSKQHELQVYAVLLLKTGSIPKTSSGKIQHHACQTGFLDGSLALVGTWTANNVAKCKQHARVMPPVPDIRFPSYTEPLTYPNLQTNSSTMTVDIAAAPEISKKRADDLIDWLRKYANERINSRLIDERRCVPPHIIMDLGNHGIFGMQVPEKYEGFALRHRDAMRVMKQIAAIDLTLATIVGLNNSLGIHPIKSYATQALRDELLPVLARGRELSAFALTEIGAGSHLGAISAIAVPDTKGSWRLRGIKRWNGSAWAGVINVFVQLTNESGKLDGLTGFVLRQGMAGLSIGPEALTMGLRGIVQNPLYLEEVAVGADNLLGELGKGMEVADDALLHSRLGIGIVSVGGMKRCAQLMLRFATRRSIVTGRLLDNPVTLAHLSNLTAAITTVETLVALIAELLDEGFIVPIEASMVAKIAATEYLWRTADDLVQLLGGRGYMENNIAPQILRDARVFRIGEGANETLNMFVGMSVLQTDKVYNFLRDQLGVPSISDRLRDAALQINARCLGPNAPFSDRSSANSWAYALSGEVAICALLLAAVQSAAERAPSKQLRRAVEWAQLQFDVTLAKALTGTPAESVLLSPNEMTDLVSSYAEAVGDLEQTLAGEDNSLDPLLRRNPVGEISHGMTELPRSLALDSSVSQPDSKISPQTAESIAAWLKERIADEFSLESEAIDMRRSFLDYGLDSVKAVTLAFELEDWLGQKLSPTVLWDYPTIAALAQHLAEKTDISLAAVNIEPNGRKNFQDNQANITNKIDQGNAEQVLAKLEQISDREVDALLSEMLAAKEVGK